MHWRFIVTFPICTHLNKDSIFFNTKGCFFLKKKYVHLNKNYWLCVYIVIVTYKPLFSKISIPSTAYFKKIYLVG